MNLSKLRGMIAEKDRLIKDVLPQFMLAHRHLQKNARRDNIRH